METRKNILSTSKADLKDSLRQITGKLHNFIALGLFIIGMATRIIAAGQTGALWSILGELGSFIAAVIAIPFIYERFLKTEDRQVFLSDLDDLLDTKLSMILRPTGKNPIVHEEGRLTVPQKVDFFKDAEKEVVELATAARSFVAYFESRPYREFKQPVVELLKRGVNFTVLVLDPQCPVAVTYADDFDEEDLLNKIERSIEGLLKLQEEFANAGYRGKFQVFRYSQLPSCYLLDLLHK